MRLYLGGQFDKGFSRKRLAGIVLVLLGAMLRFEQFLVETVVFSSAGVLYLLALRDVPPKERRKRFFLCVRFFFVLFLIAFGLKGVDRLTYSSPEWQEYLDFNSARTELLDYGMPDYEKNQKALAQIGIDKTAYQQIRVWMHTDPEKMSASVLEKMVEMKTPPTINMRYLFRFVIKMGKGFVKRIYINGFGLFCICVFCWLIAGKKQLPQILTIIYMLFLLGAMFFYLYYRGRYLKERVDVGIWTAAALVLLLMCHEQKRLLPSWAGLSTFALIVFLILYFQRGRLWTHSQAAIEARREGAATLEEIGEDSEHLYITKGAPSYTESYPIWGGVPYGVETNLFKLGGWFAQTPVAQLSLQRFGIVNPLKEMIDNESVYLIANSPEGIMEYIHKWYNKDAKLENVKMVGEYQVYRIVSGQN